MRQPISIQALAIFFFFFKYDGLSFLVNLLAKPEIFSPLFSSTKKVPRQKVLPQVIVKKKYSEKNWKET